MPYYVGGANGAEQVRTCDEAHQTRLAEEEVPRKNMSKGDEAGAAVL